MRDTLGKRRDAPAVARRHLAAVQLGAEVPRLRVADHRALISGGVEQAPSPRVDAQRPGPIDLDAAADRRAGRQPGHPGGHLVDGHRCIILVDTRTRSPSPPASTICDKHSKNCLARRITSADSSEQIAARLLAAATNLCADTTVVVMGRVTIALLGTRTTRDHARLDRRANQTEVGLGLTGHDPACVLTHVGAVEIETNTPHQLGHVRLA
jgi:hypothetical protein